MYFLNHRSDIADNILSAIRTLLQNAPLGDEEEEEEEEGEGEGEEGEGEKEPPLDREDMRIVEALPSKMQVSSVEKKLFFPQKRCI